MLDWINVKLPSLKKSILKPFVINVNPNAVTLFALFVAIAAGLAFYRQLLIPAALLVLFNGFLDILDGEIARKYGSSKRGDLLDHTVDRLADIAMIAGITGGGFVEPWIGAATIVIVLLVSYIGTEAHALTKKRLYAGMLTRADRIVIIAAGAIAGFFLPGALGATVFIISVLSALTFGQRFGILWRTLR